MTDIIRSYGIKEMIMKDLKEINGFHEITEKEVSYVTQPEWKAILLKHYRGIDIQDKNVSVDLNNEIITLE
jgi:hypothetical protein